MAITYLCTHYFVTFTKFEEINIDKNELKYDTILNRLTSSKTTITTTTPKKQPINVVPLNSIRFDRPKLYLDSYKHLKHRYNLRNKTVQYNSQIMQDKIIIHLLNTSVLNEVGATYNGLFVEAGAYDGETWSNTLHLERFRNWTGLLIEPSVENYRILRGKNRNSISVNSCLCAGKSSVNSSYIEAGPFGITTNTSNAVSSSSSSLASLSTFGGSSFSPIYSITCHPLANVLDLFFSQFLDLKQKKSRISDAHSTTIIDYMSLDIEGSEKQTIETFPFNRYQFNLLNIEFNQNKNTYKWIKSYLKQFGYVEIIVDDVWYQDMYLAHESILPKLNRDFSRVSQLLNLKKLK